MQQLTGSIRIWISVFAAVSVGAGPAGTGAYMPALIERNALLIDLCGFPQLSSRLPVRCTDVDPGKGEHIACRNAHKGRRRPAAPADRTIGDIRSDLVEDPTPLPIISGEVFVP